MPQSKGVRHLSSLSEGLNDAKSRLQDGDTEGAMRMLKAMIEALPTIDAEIRRLDSLEEGIQGHTRPGR